MFVQASAVGGGRTPLLPGWSLDQLNHCKTSLPWSPWARLCSGAVGGLKQGWVTYKQSQEEQMEGPAHWQSPGYLCSSKKPSAQMLSFLASFLVSTFPGPLCLSLVPCPNSPWLSLNSEVPSDTTLGLMFGVFFHLEMGLSPPALQEELISVAAPETLIAAPETPI